MSQYANRTFAPRISCSVNRKGVLDIDTVKGCRCGMDKYPNGGCYGLCYAAKLAKVYGFDFSVSVSRLPSTDDPRQGILFPGLFCGGPKRIYDTVKYHKGPFFRIGTMGDPCHDWQLTTYICGWLCHLKVPVVITKHWITIPDDLLTRLEEYGAIVNTSISPLDTKDEIEHRLSQFNRLGAVGIRSVLRIVSCKFGETETGNRLDIAQARLFRNAPLIDNPLRIPLNDPRVVRGDIVARSVKDLHGKVGISIANKKTYIGECGACPDQCGIFN